MCAGDYLSLNPSPDTTDGKRLTNHVATVSRIALGRTPPPDIGRRAIGCLQSERSNSGAVCF